MRQFVNYILLTVLGLVFLSGCQAQKASIRGPQGEIAYKITLPDGFDPTKDQCPMVILMHGIFSSKAYGPHATLKVVGGENHTITRRRKQVVAETVEFFRAVFGR